jgi:hypothetical protein
LRLQQAADGNFRGDWVSTALFSSGIIYLMRFITVHEEYGIEVVYIVLVRVLYQNMEIFFVFMTHLMMLWVAKNMPY